MRLQINIHSYMYIRMYGQLHLWCFLLVFTPSFFLPRSSRNVQRHKELSVCIVYTAQ